MRRRKYLAALGSAAAGGAAMMGTGAFTSATVDRSVAINVADDASAYIGFDASTGQNSNFAEFSGDQLDITLDGDGVSGSGINEDSEYSILNIAEVLNQGTQEYFFYVDPLSVTIGGDQIVKFDSSSGYVVDGPAKDYIDPQGTNFLSGGGGSLTGVYRVGRGGTASIDPVGGD